MVDYDVKDVLCDDVSYVGPRDEVLHPSQLSAVQDRRRKIVESRNRFARSWRDTMICYGYLD